MKLLHKASRWYFSSKALPYWLILALDCICVFFAGFVAFYLENGGDSFTSNFWQLILGMLISLLFYIVGFRLFHTYSGILRFSSFIDLRRIGAALFVGSVLVYLFYQLTQHYDLSSNVVVPDLSMIVTIFIIATMLIWLIRIVAKSMYESYRKNEFEQSVFIYGAMSGGVALAKNLLNNPDSKYRLAGIVSTDAKVAESWMFGMKVTLDNDNLPKQMKDKGASVLIVSPLQREHFSRRTTLIDALIEAGIKILMIPNAEEWDGQSEIHQSQLKEVDIEDLLPRDKIEVDMDAIGAMLRGKRILITGAAGSIGSEMAHQVAKFDPAELVLVDQAETPMHDVRRYMANNHPTLKALTIVGSITNNDHMEKIFSEHRPEYVFHAAAYKHVPMMEDNPAMAIQNNVYGTRVIADLAVKYGTKKFVMISTDKAVNPTNVMGCSKRICEIYCQSLNKALQDGYTLSSIGEASPYQGDREGLTQFITTRFGNVLGSNGSVIPIFKEQIRKGGPVMVTHPDIIRFFMLIPEACRLVLEAGTMGKGGEIFVFDMGEPVRIVDLAQRMIRLSGAKGVEIQFSGLRDGEKLFEEVLNDAEQTKPTVHPKIKVAAVREYPYELALKNEIELHKLSFTFDDMAIVKKMKEIVPEYKSQHSKYSALDK